jgi:enoyl-CoA hydratase/carnithine racemase
MLPQDLRITYANNKVGFVFAARGIITEAASSFFLPKLVGMTAAMALLTTAQVLPASHDWLKPLWSVVLDKPDQVLPHAVSMAEDIVKRCSGGESSIFGARRAGSDGRAVSHAVNKTLVWNAKSNPEEHHILDSLGIYLISERDGKEGIQSFLEKRDPKFTDSYQHPTIQGYLRMIKARL